ncbi:PAS domain-containing protein [Defluviimonas sp. D31]|uniref:PAS domain-containing protein n=1 Tax=Defluviimonas sp. D31 TaxID=3083253 RepID=UPI00296E3131|nr:PAS domain-containing protein [Defluviimonas sp. D31]MDW4551636.1 PAS domain-containing protein [Defluviimonas sp. D31]
MNAPTTDSQASPTAALHVLKAERDLLIAMLSSSTEACWCMEFREPIDLTAPNQEVVRQVFENRPYWRFCNEAMAQLYLLPAGKDFNDQPVSDIFPRNSQNEAFIENLLSNGFEADAVPALDMRYDGEAIHVENDVRGHVENGQLIRMFGVVRDVGKHYRREAQLAALLRDAQAALDMFDEAVIGLSRDLRIVIINSATEKLLGRSREKLMAADLSEVLGALGNVPAEEIADRLSAGAGAGQISVEARRIGWRSVSRAVAGDGGIARLLTFSEGVADD